MSVPVRHLAVFALVMLACAWGSGCALSPSVQPTQTQIALVGMTKADLILCAGAPLRETTGGEATELTYDRAASPMEQYFSARGGIPCSRLGCEARVVLKDGRVTSVEYSRKSEAKDACNECDEIFTKCQR